MKTTVAGAFYRMNPIVRTLLKEGAVLGWKREPENQFDKNAVLLTMKDSLGKEHSVGYVPANIAVRLAPHLDRGCDLEVVITGTPLGPDDSTVQVKLDLDVGSGRTDEPTAPSPGGAGPR